MSLASETVDRADAETRRDLSERDTPSHPPSHGGRSERSPDRGEDKAQDETISRRDGQGDKSSAGQGDTSDEGKKKGRWPLVVLGIVVRARDHRRRCLLVPDARPGKHRRRLHRRQCGVHGGQGLRLRGTERDVDDNTVVQAGDLLLRIDPRDYLTARDQARANLHWPKRSWRAPGRSWR